MLAIALALQALSQDVRPIDFAKVPRSLVSEPTYLAEPRFGLFLFGLDGDVRIWTVLDKSWTDGEVYDVLYIDRDADGVLGEPGERLEGVVNDGEAVFEIGTFRQPGSETIHEQFEITWTKTSVRFRMLWRGKTLTMGGYGPKHDTYAPFGSSPAEATIYVPGYDRPLEFEHWMSGTLHTDRSTDFKVFLGHRGSREGAFSCGDDELLPKGEYVLATLVYRDAEGRTRRHQIKLEERC